jgi:hypothetical protein
MRYKKIILVAMIVCRSLSFATSDLPLLSLDGGRMSAGYVYAADFPKDATEAFMESLSSSTSTGDSEDGSKHGLLSITFADKETWEFFKALFGDFTFHIFPILGDDVEAYQRKKFYEGPIKGVPYTVTYNNAHLIMPTSLDESFIIPSHCASLDDRFGHYCLWDRQQVVAIKGFSLNLFQEDKGEFPLISWTSPPSDHTSYIFPISPPHINNVEEGVWSLVNIQLKHVGDSFEEGWSFEPSLINNRGMKLLPESFPKEKGPSLRDVQRDILHNNSHKGAVYKQVATLDAEGYEVDRRGERVIEKQWVFISSSKTVDEDGAEDENIGWIETDCYNRHIEGKWIHIPV